MKAVWLAVVTAMAVVAAQGPTGPVPPTADERREIENRLAELSTRIDALTASKTDPALIADVAIYRKAAEYILRFPEEFATKAFVPDTLRVLDTGLTRARELKAGAPSWPTRKGHVVRGYVSKLDGSVQPYGLTIPASYDGSKPVRLDIWQHGTNRALNEVAFIVQQESDKPVPPEQNYIQIEPLGRTNVAYRWAGEADLFESLASVQQRYRIDPKRIVLRGFSMGGASTWHLGLHHPGRWAAIESGAGFTETRNYGHRETLPPYQEAMLHYYDAADYSLNAFNAPTVGYGGEDDAQLRASVNIREQLAKEGMRFTQDGPFRWVSNDLRAIFLVGPKTGHSWHPDSRAESNAFINKALETADEVPDRVRFVTYTARFNRAHWLTVDALDRTYERADVDARRSPDGKQYTVTTKNVSRLTVESGTTFTIDGQALVGRPFQGRQVTFEKTNGAWTIAKGEPAGLRKIHGLQGPVDDAFMDAFVCVRPTGAPWNAIADDWPGKTLSVFQTNFAKWLRGDVRVKNDRAVTDSDIADHNLILFGDPNSNSVIAKVIGRLPLRWTKSSIEIGGRTFSAADHVAVIVYPNPLNPKRYVVVNSGHTFGDEDFRGTNAWLYPRLGDYAVLNANGDIALSGFFDERWQAK
jgi:dienelactone hydrolase